MLAYGLPLHAPLTPGGQKVIFSFLKVVMLHVKLNGKEAENTMQANILPFYTPTTPRWGQKLSTIFFWRRKCNNAAYQIKGKGV